MNPINIIIVSLFSWSPAVNLGIPGVDDIMPQSVRWQAEHTCVVFQSRIGGDWEICSRFLTAHAPFYTDTFRITDNTGDDVDPVVAYDETRQCYWCAWQGSTGTNRDIFVSYGDSLNGWSAPYPVTADPASDEHPSLCVINDTVWLAWQRDFPSLFNIAVAFYCGAGWSIPQYVTADSAFDNILPKINGHYERPLVVWMRNRDIYCSERNGGAWQIPFRVSSHPAPDTAPEIAVERTVFSPGVNGAWIFWQSGRDGNDEIYCTAKDTFSVSCRVTVDDSADATPSPLEYGMILGRQNPAAVAIRTRRNGGDDIYALYGSGWNPYPVDSDASSDLNPCLSGGDLRVWAFWQSDRHGDWDICGSHFWVGGVDDNGSGVAGGVNVPAAKPNPFAERTAITFGKGHGAESVVLRIYDAAGRMVKLFDRLTLRSFYQITWDGTDDHGRLLEPGVYFCTAGQGNCAVKLIKTK